MRSGAIHGVSGTITRHGGIGTFGATEWTLYPVTVARSPG
jgi:hypothetical protein